MPFVGKQTNLSYKLLDHVPTAEEAEDFEEETWYYYPARDAIGEETGGTGGGAALSGEFTSMNFLEKGSIDTATVQNGQFNLYPVGDLITGIGSGDLPGGGTSTLAGDFKAIEFKEGVDVSGDVPALGNLNFYRAGDILNDAEVTVPVGPGGDFTKMAFKENADISTDVVDAGSFILYPVGDTLGNGDKD